MDEKTTDVGDVEEESGLTIVTVPTEQAQAVIDFVAGLESEDSDVSGHMIAGGAGAFGGGALLARMTTSTGCSQSVTGKLGYDMTCYDTDKIVT
ncbi:MAG: hypothetical protein WBW04_21145 [Nitrolancea sp.]